MINRKLADAPFRDYNPATGTYRQKDPIGFASWGDIAAAGALGFVSGAAQSLFPITKIPVPKIPLPRCATAIVKHTVNTAVNGAVNGAVYGGAKAAAVKLVELERPTGCDLAEGILEGALGGGYGDAHANAKGLEYSLEALRGGLGVKDAVALGKGIGKGIEDAVGVGSGVGVLGAKEKLGYKCAPKPKPPCDCERSPLF